jgi:electron transfer flavoprotein beta subunit
VIAVCWKWVAAADGDERWSGVSEPDRAALEVGLLLAAAVADEVTTVSVGPHGADRALREALAAGAARAVRVDAPSDLASATVAAAIADVVSGAAWVVCGDVSADRGSGSVPAFVAAELDAAQALGLVEVAPGTGPLTVTRRLDGGRREVLSVTAPGVLSVEGAVARLRRAPLRAELAAGAARPRRRRRALPPPRPRRARPVRHRPVPRAPADRRHRADGADPRAAHPGPRRGGGSDHGRAGRVGLRAGHPQPFQLNIRPEPCVMNVPSMTRSECGVSRRIPNDSASGLVHIGMIDGS